MRSLEIPFRRFDEPLQEYSKEVRQIKTIDDVRRIEEKFYFLLDDAAPCYANINEETFVEFKKQMPLCFREDRPPTDDWMKKFGAVILPKLFIDLAPMYRFQMPSGFFMSRLLESGLAEMKDGRFTLRAEFYAVQKEKVIGHGDGKTSEI